MRFLSVAIAALFLITGTLPSTLAAGKSKKKSPAPVTDTNDKITAVHLTSISISVYATHSAKEYRVTPATKITVNGQPAQLNGLSTGMNVVVAPAPDGVTAAAIDAKSAKH